MLFPAAPATRTIEHLAVLMWLLPGGIAVFAPINLFHGSYIGMFSAIKLMTRHPD